VLYAGLVVDRATQTVCLMASSEGGVDVEAAEINPLVLVEGGRLLALDAKLSFDSNALFRHPEIVAMRDLNEEDAAEIRASKFDLSDIALDRNLGCLEKVTEAFKITLDNSKVKGILVNIFGGIMRCDTIATGVIEAARPAPPRWGACSSRRCNCCPAFSGHWPEKEASRD